MLGALVAGIMVGALLGALGGGGSLLAVPLLVHLAGQSLAAATGTSLLAVGAAALVGARIHYGRGNVDGRAALAFGSATLAASFAGARLSAGLDEVLLTKLLALVTLAAGIAMALGLKRRGPGPVGPGQGIPGLPFLLGAGVGVLTGLVGVGGGFLIVPALALGSGLPMRAATGTSLVVIALGAAAALAGNPGRVPTGDPRAWAFLLAALPAAWVGVEASAWVAPERLERTFGALLVLAAASLVLGG